MEKVDKLIKSLQDLIQESLEKRCWEGYEPTPGKKPYEKGSCQPVSKEEASEELKISKSGQWSLEKTSPESKKLKRYKRYDEMARGTKADLEGPSPISKPTDLSFAEDERDKAKAAYESEVANAKTTQALADKRAAQRKLANKPVQKSEDDVEVAPKNSTNKKTYEKAFKKSLADNELELVEWNNGDIELIVGQNVADEVVEIIVKNIVQTGEFEELEKKEWSPKAEHKSEKGGLTEAGRKSYNKATGGNLKRPQPEGGPRKRSFCARNKGQIDMHNIDCKKTPEKRACKARRRWKC